MSLETVTLEDALRLLSLPRVLGEVDGEEITAQNGRYGPYVQKGKETRSLESEEQLFTITLEEALDLLAKPKERRGRGKGRRSRSASSGPIQLSGKPIVVKDGRFGPYVTDGETNASLRRGDDPETVTLERAIELLAERRAKGPLPRRKPFVNQIAATVLILHKPFSERVVLTIESLGGSNRFGLARE